MTGKEAIIHYLGTHKSFCVQDVAAVTGATVTSINQVAAKMARARILVIDGKGLANGVLPVRYRGRSRKEKVSTNLIFKGVSPECRDETGIDVLGRVEGV